MREASRSPTFVKVSARKLGALLLSALLFVGAGFLPAATPEGAIPGAVPELSLRAGSDTYVLATDSKPFLVPIYARRGDDVTAVHIGLDYDELMLRYNDSWSVDGASGTQPWEIIHDEESGYLEMTIPFGSAVAPKSTTTEMGVAGVAGAGNQDDELLIQIEFLVKPLPEAETKYRGRGHASLDLKDQDTYFLHSDSSRVKADEALDGRVTIYYRDALEVGSARMTPKPGQFRVPIFGTHMTPENVVFHMGLDYDELFLSLLQVEPVSPHLNHDAVRFDAKNGADFGWVDAPFLGGVYPRVLRHHLFNLVFEYRPGVEIPPPDFLKITPVPEYTVGAGGGGGQVEVREGRVYLVQPSFLRGDADSSGQLEISDPLMILAYSLQGLSESSAPTCLDALDGDGSGHIDITDAILVFDYLFLGGAPPAPPFPAVGPAPEASASLGCEGGETEFEPLPLENE